MAYACRREERGKGAVLAGGVHLAAILLWLLVDLGSLQAPSRETATRVKLMEAEPLPPPELIQEPPRPVAAKSEQAGLPNSPPPAQVARAPTEAVRDVIDTTPSLGAVAPKASVAAREGEPEQGFSSSSGTGSGSGQGGGGGSGTSPERPAPARLGSRSAQWILRPLAEMKQMTPWKARRDNVSGIILLSCLVNEQNRARKCKVVSEDPADYGFGRAAIRLSRHFLVKPPEVDGVPRHDVRVEIPLKWEFQ